MVTVCIVGTGFLGTTFIVISPYLPEPSFALAVILNVPASLAYARAVVSVICSTGNLSAFSLSNVKCFMSASGGVIAASILIPDPTSTSLFVALRTIFSILFSACIPGSLSNTAYTLISLSTLVSFVKFTSEALTGFIFVLQPRKLKPTMSGSSGISNPTELPFITSTALG